MNEERIMPANAKVPLRREHPSAVSPHGITTYRPALAPFSHAASIRPPPASPNSASTSASASSTSSPAPIATYLPVAPARESFQLDVLVLRVRERDYAPLAIGIRRASTRASPDDPRLSATTFQLGRVVRMCAMRLTDEGIRWVRFRMRGSDTSLLCWTVEAARLCARLAPVQGRRAWLYESLGMKLTLTRDYYLDEIELRAFVH